MPSTPTAASPALDRRPPPAGADALPRVHVVVLNWNGRDDTVECLASLQRVTYPAMTVTVADNGSADGSVAAIRERFPHVDVVENGANLGFAGGNNTAIERALDAAADFVLVLNNDTEVDAGLIDGFLRAAEQLPQAGVFGAKIYQHADPQRLWFAGGYWDAATLSFNEYGAGDLDDGQFDTVREVDWVIGCAMFVRAAVFRRIGLLEPSFFLNNEEVDFCSRARRAGFACAYAPQARLWHKISVSFGGEDSPLKEYFSARNRLLWARRNTSGLLRWRIYASGVRGVLRRFTRALAGRSVTGPLTPRSWWWSVRSAFAEPRNRAAAMGLRDFVLRRFGNCPDRVRELSREWSARRRAQAST